MAESPKRRNPFLTLAFVALLIGICDLRLPKARTCGQRIVSSARNGEKTTSVF